MIMTSDPSFERWAQESTSFEEDFEVIGNDTRFCVQDTSIPPHPYVCYITRHTSPSRDARGRTIPARHVTWTGTLIGPRTVLTVAHWLYEKSTMKLISPNNMYAVPGMNAWAASLPFPPSKVASFVTAPNYKPGVGDTTSSDLAVIILSSPVGVLSQSGSTLRSNWWTFDFHKWPGDTDGTSILQGTFPGQVAAHPRPDLHIIGYPRERPKDRSDRCFDPKRTNLPGKVQYRSSNWPVQSPSPEFMEYLNDTSIGMGGSPVWYYSKAAGRVLAGVHVARDDKKTPTVANRGIRIQGRARDFVRAHSFWPSQVQSPARPTLGVGARGRDVEELQHRLNIWILGLGPSFPSPASPIFAPAPVPIPRLVVNGLFDNSMRVALLEFQRAVGLQPSGSADPPTWQQLQWPF